MAPLDVITKPLEDQGVRSRAEIGVKSVLDGLSSHIAILNGSGTIVEINGAWASFAKANGLTMKDSGLGANYLEVCDSAIGAGAEVARKAARGIRKVLTGKRGAFFLEYSCHGPEEKRWFQLRVNRLAGASRTHVVVVHENITEIKKAEDVLRQDERRFRQLLETTKAIPWEADAKTWRFTYVGPQATRLLGYPLERWYEKDFWATHIHSEDREAAIRTCLQASKRCKEYDFSYRMISSSGQVVWIHDIVSVVMANDSPVALRGFMIDVTDREQLSESLRGQHAFLRQVIDVTPNFIFAKDREGRFTLVNQAVADAYGTTVENLIGKTDGDFNPNPDEVEFFRNMDLDVMNTLQERFIPEERITDASGRTRWLQTVKRPIVDQNGRADQVLGSSSDITERKRVEQSLQERLRFEALVSSLSARFAHVRGKDIGTTIDASLKLLGEFFDADRCAIVEFSDDGEELRASHAWHSDRLGPHDRPPGHILSLTLGARWREGKVVAFSRSDQIPSEQMALREAMERAGFKSHLSVPLKIGGEFIGAVGIASIVKEREWSGEVVQRFKLVGEIFANGLTRKQAVEALQNLSGRLINAEEEAQRALARELHDDVSQRLAVLGIEAGLLEKALDSTEVAQRRLQGMKEQIIRLSADIHRLSRQLHPSILDDLGLVAAVESECNRFSEHERINLEFKSDLPKDLPLPVNTSLCLYRVVQEGLRNIAKHSRAEQAGVSLATKEGKVLLTIRDSGAGFTAGRLKRESGVGLASMEERVKLVGGQLFIRSQPGVGTVIEVQVPLGEDVESR